MSFNLLYDNPNEDILTRLLKVRNVSCSVQDFLDPKMAQYWLNPYLLADMEKAVERIISAMKLRQKICIFGDYDVDGVTSSYLVYTFFKKFLGYTNISIRYPHRLHDGYGIKNKHVDEMKADGVDLIITVDNGITSIQEALHAKQIGIDLIITDHHNNLPDIPQAYAVVNPQISPNYPFKGICGAGVAFKLVCALMEKSTLDKEKKQQIFQYFVPIVAIATVADCVPLVHENRVLVKRGLELMNHRRAEIPESLRGFIEYLNIKTPIDTFHIGFMIGPRINAGGRIMTPYESLYTLLYTGAKQLEYLQQIDEINTERKRLQEQANKIAEQLIDPQEFILIAGSEEFHEGVVGIVSGRLTEKYNKPSMVYTINQEKQIATASLRGPEYFHVSDMLQTMDDILMCFGGHKQAGGLTVSLENLPILQERLCAYAKQYIKAEDMVKKVAVDTKLYVHEREPISMHAVQKLAPFGQGNEEPLFLLENIQIEKKEKVGSRGKGHLKLHGQFGDRRMHVLMRGKGDCVDEYDASVYKHLLGRIKTDSYSGQHFIEGVALYK